jgi:RNA polymerase sigma-70 factor (ECF subfamily)
VTALEDPFVTTDAAEADERLLVEAAQRDPNRFGELYERHLGLVYGFVARRVRDRVIAEDLTSDVFHQALAALPRFEWRGVPFAAWLLRIARNALADHWQRTAREGAALAPAPDPPEEVDLAEAMHRARLFALVDELPEDQRRVVTMRFAEEKSIRETAGVLGRSEGAVKQLQFRALQALRAQVGH